MTASSPVSSASATWSDIVWTIWSSRPASCATSTFLRVDAGLSDCGSDSMRHVAHPRLTSFCHAVSERARAVLVRAGHDLIHHDLYAEEFEPCLTAEEAYTV